LKSELFVKNMNELTPDQFMALRRLKVSQRQEFLGKSFEESIEDWENATREEVLGLCFLCAERPVGLTLFNQSGGKTVSIHGLKIATPLQGRGWGHIGFRLAVEYLKEAWPEIERLKLAVDAENKAAIAVYARFGMTDYEPVFQGSHGDEHHMDVSLVP
jgi:RimJ/RimL family protein N-acetyltransferase